MIETFFFFFTNANKLNEQNEKHHQYWHHLIHLVTAHLKINQETRVLGNTQTKETNKKEQQLILSLQKTWKLANQIILFQQLTYNSNLLDITR